MQWYWVIFQHDLDWYFIHHFSVICTRVMTLDLRQNFCFRSISLEQIDRFSLNFMYAFILIRSSLGLLHDIFRTFVPEIWPLIYAKILYPLNILRTNWLIFTKLYIYAFILISSRLRLPHMIFRTFVIVLLPLIYARFLFLLNILWKKWQIFTKFYIFILIDKI